MSEATPTKKDGRQFINNEPALLQALANLDFPEEWTWVETLTLEPSGKSHQLPQIDASDDLQREGAFYQACCASLPLAVQLFSAQDVKYQRPADFFAEMIKPDSHMERVKAVLLRDQRRVEIAQERRQIMEHKKYRKETQRAKRTEKQQARNKQARAIQELKKRSGGQGMTKAQIMEAVGGGGASSVSGKKRGRERSGPSVHAGRKRRAKDQKYGFGGRKGRNKRNGFDSSAELPMFDRNRKRNGGGNKNVQKRYGGARNSQKKRPGKSKRAH